MSRDGQPAPPAPHASERPNASLARRFAALVYESFLVGAVVLVAGFLTLPVVSPTAMASHALEVPPLPSRVVSACAVFGIAGLYCIWSWTGGRRTLPMKTWRLSLVRRDRRAVRAVDGRTGVIRYFALWIGPLVALLAYGALIPSGLARYAWSLVALNYLWAFVDSDRQFLHDRIAGTRIAWEPPGEAGAVMRTRAGPASDVPHSAP